MKPVDFDYVRAATLAEASQLLCQEETSAKIVAGSQSLGPMLNLRLVQPGLLIDITAIPELCRVEETAEGVILGACVTHADIEDGRVPDPTGGVLARIARGIAYRAVRNRGTIGGSLGHADPAADWVSTLSALGADILIYGSGQRRILGADAFITGAFETALSVGEIVEAVRIPRLSKGARWGYCKLCRKPGEFAYAMCATLTDCERRVRRVVVGALDSSPIVVDAAGAPESGRSHTEIALGSIEKILDDRGVTEPVGRQLHIAAFKRAMAQAGQ